MKRLFLALIAIGMSAALFAAEPAADTAKTKTKAVWNKGLSATIGFSQLSLTNWAAGGAGQLTLNTFADLFANMTKGRFLWTNELQAGYGFIESFDTG